jgi:hypothetical protein
VELSGNRKRQIARAQLKRDGRVRHLRKMNLAADFRGLTQISVYPRKSAAKILLLDEDALCFVRDIRIIYIHIDDQLA